MGRQFTQSCIAQYVNRFLLQNSAKQGSWSRNFTAYQVFFDFIQIYSLECKGGPYEKKNSLYACVGGCVYGKVKGQKNIDVFRVQKSKKHDLRWVQRSKKHWFLPGSKVKKTSSEMGSKFEKTLISSGFKSQKNMVWDGFTGRKNIDFFCIHKLKNIIPSTVGRIIWKKKFVCVCVCVYVARSKVKFVIDNNPQSGKDQCWGALKLTNQIQTPLKLTNRIWLILKLRETNARILKIHRIGS